MEPASIVETLFTHRPSDDFAAEQVYDGGDIEPAFTAMGYV